MAVGSGRSVRLAGSGPSLSDRSAAILDVKASFGDLLFGQIFAWKCQEQGGNFAGVDMCNLSSAGFLPTSPRVLSRTLRGHPGPNMRDAAIPRNRSCCYRGLVHGLVNGSKMKSACRVEILDTIWTRKSIRFELKLG